MFFSLATLAKTMKIFEVFYNIITKHIFEYPKKSKSCMNQSDVPSRTSKSQFADQIPFNYYAPFSFRNNNHYSSAIFWYVLLQTTSSTVISMRNLSPLKSLTMVESFSFRPASPFWSRDRTLPFLFKKL